MGCGNSNFSIHLSESGTVGEIINIDFSDIVLKEMIDKCGSKYSCMRWELMDMTDLKYDDCAFQACIDKGSLDALMSVDSTETKHLATQMFYNIERVLQVENGVYICVTLCQDYILKTIIEYFTASSNTGSKFSIDIHIVPEMKDNPLVPFVFVIRRYQTTSIEVDFTSHQYASLYCDTIGVQTLTALQVPFDEIVDKVALLYTVIHHYLRVLSFNLRYYSWQYRSCTSRSTTRSDTNCCPSNLTGSRYWTSTLNLLTLLLRRSQLVI